MAVIERKSSFGVKVHRGGGDYEWVGSFRFDDYGGKRAARRAAVDAEAKALGRRAARRRTETCDSFAERWPEDYSVAKRGPTRGRQKSRETLRTYRYALKPFREEFGGLRLGEVDRPAARAFAARHPTSVVVVVRSMFGDALDDGLVDSNPFANLQLRHSDGRRDVRVISHDELLHLADAALDAHGPQYGPMCRAAILFSAYVGPREESLWHLEWADCNLEERTVHFRVVKFDKPYTAVLLPEAVEVLRSFPRRLDTPLVFTAIRGGQFTKGSHFYAWDRVRQRAGMGEFEWHELRHWCGHHFYVTLGFSAEEAGAQLGHKDGRMIRELYGHGQQGALERLRKGTEPTRVARFPVASQSHEAQGS